MKDFSSVSPSETAQHQEVFVERPPEPDTVPGRVLHIDGDFVCYQHGCRHETESLSKSIAEVELSLNILRVMAGAETAVVHITMSDSDKGGRYEIARLKEYQAHRKEPDPALSGRVQLIREWIAEDMSSDTLTASPQSDQEADDSLAQAMFQDPTAVLWSLDKDLWMIGGTHLTADYELVEYPWDYGSTRYCKDKKKLIGNGLSFFFHQLLMGDSADNIPGLPKVMPETQLKYMPLPKYYTDALGKPAKTPKQAQARIEAIKKAEARLKPKACGAATAAAMLSRCKDPKHALAIVTEAYMHFYGHHHIFETWDGKKKQETCSTMMLEQARLLWIRREKGQDVLTVLKEIAHA